MKKTEREKEGATIKLEAPPTSKEGPKKKKCC